MAEPMLESSRPNIQVLPEPHTEFVFTVSGGGLAFLVLLVLLLAGGLWWRQRRRRRRG